MVLQQPKATSKRKGLADVVFCIDVTGSMAPFLDTVKSKVKEFVSKLEKSGEGQNFPVDWRIKVVGYRDVFEDGERWIEGLDNPFTNDPDTVFSQLAGLVPEGGGDDPETLLDALFTITRNAKNNNEWRESVHRFIVVFTDTTSKENMHEKTVEPGEALDVQNVLNILAEEKIKLIYYGPRCNVTDSFKMLPSSHFDYCKELGDGLKTVNWDEKLNALRKTISEASKPVPA